MVAAGSLRPETVLGRIADLEKSVADLEGAAGELHFLIELIVARLGRMEAMLAVPAPRSL